MTEGTLIKINENGSPVEFYLAKHNYEPGLNGQGRELVVRKDCYDQRSWNSPDANAWASSGMLSWLNRNYKALLSPWLQETIGNTTYHYTPGENNNTVTSRSDGIFLLSLTELGFSDTFANVEGSALPIASTLRIACVNGAPAYQWTRSPYTYNDYSVWSSNPNGIKSSIGASASYGSRPCFTLPSTATVTEELELVEG